MVEIYCAGIGATTASTTITWVVPPDHVDWRAFSRAVGKRVRWSKQHAFRQGSDSEVQQSLCGAVWRARGTRLGKDRPACGYCPQCMSEAKSLKGE